MRERSLPPWGMLDAGYVASIAKEPIPKDWKLQNGASPTLSNWKYWRGQRLYELERLLWPIYRTRGSKWRLPRVTKLIDTDFELLRELRKYFVQPINARSLTNVTHAVFFNEEDDEYIGLGSHYERYDPLLDLGARARMAKTLLDELNNKVGTLALQLKQRLQRPRAYQVAHIQGRTEFSHEPARTADTPSMVSGHCLQGAISACGFYSTCGSLPQKSKELLKQFTVDIGDRRVFAGVHYPSDNLASWIVALHLIKRVFPIRKRQPVHDFLKSAIRDKSAVYAKIRDHVSSNPGSPYKKAYQVIEEFN